MYTILDVQFHVISLYHITLYMKLSIFIIWKSQGKHNSQKFLEWIRVEKNPAINL